MDVEYLVPTPGQVVAVMHQRLTAIAVKHEEEEDDDILREAFRLVNTNCH